MSNHPTGEPPNKGSNDPNPNPNNNFFSNPGSQRLWIIVILVAIFLLVVFIVNPRDTQSSDISIREIALAIEYGVCEETLGDLNNLQFYNIGQSSEQASNSTVTTSATSNCNPVGISNIIISGGNKINVIFDDHTDPQQATSVSSFIDTNDSLVTILTEYGVSQEMLQNVSISYEPGDNTGSILLNIAIFVLPTIIIVWFLWRMMRSVRSGQDQAMSFGRSRARVSRDMERPQVTFDDVAGAEEAKEELKEVVEFLEGTREIHPPWGACAKRCADGWSSRVQVKP